MTGEQPNTSPVVVDEAYKNATQSVVDNNMRTDVLGPHFCKVLTTHTPASDAIIALIAQKVNAEPELKRNIKLVIEDYNKETKMGLINKAIGALGAIVFALIIWGIEYLITHH